MKLFKKKKKDQESLNTPVKQTQPTKASPNALQFTPNEYITQETPKKKSKSKWKKLKRYITGKKKDSDKKELNLVSPDVQNKANNFYSNNTEGYEIVLEGEKNIQYEENPAAASPTRTNICGLKDTSCAPSLSDWNYFVNIMSGMFTAPFGDEPNVKSGNNQNEIPTTVLTRSGTGSRGIVRGDSIPFDETQDEKLAIETTLEQKGLTDYFPGAQPQDENEVAEVHSYRKKNDGPIALDEAEEEKEHENDSLMDSPVRMGTENGNEFPMEQQPFANKNKADEELYDTVFTLKFLKEASNIGIILTYFQQLEDNMIPTTVNLTIKPGLARGTRLLEPELCWKDLRKPMDEGMQISLLGIDGITTSLNPDDDDNPFFTITTNEGKVHAFESPTLSERNYIVHGIRNVVAWLSYHLISGNMTAGTEIVSNLDERRGESVGELPSLKTPVQAMNELSHTFLD